MPLHSVLAKLPARLLSWLRFLPRSWISVYILCAIGVDPMGGPPTDLKNMAHCQEWKGQRFKKYSKKYM